MGFMIQFGSTRIPGAGYSQITFPIAFSNATYTVAGTLPQFLTDGKFGDYCVTVRTTTYMQLDYSNANATGSTNYVVFGY